MPYGLSSFSLFLSSSLLPLLPWGQRAPPGAPPPWIVHVSVSPEPDRSTLTHLASASQRPARSDSAPWGLTQLCGVPHSSVGVSHGSAGVPHSSTGVSHGSIGVSRSSAALVSWGRRTGVRTSGIPCHSPEARPGNAGIEVIYIFRASASQDLGVGQTCGHRFCSSLLWAKRIHSQSA